jgi:hypothetical protein
MVSRVRATILDVADLSTRRPERTERGDRSSNIKIDNHPKISYLKECTG